MKRGKSQMLVGRISIGRPTYGNGDKFIELNFEDLTSHVTFLTAYVSYEDFAQALTGLSGIPAKLEVRNLHNVGLEYESKPLVFKVSSAWAGKEQAEADCQIHADEGWTASKYFNSQGSIKKSNDGHYYAHGTQYRFVEPKVKNEAP